ncbi:homeodomain-containing protein, partial [Rhodovulum euryhalinum]
MALCGNRNTPRKGVWRAEIVLATADGCGTSEIMRRARTSKPTVWRWQERYLDEGIEGPQRDKTRPPRVPTLPRETRLKVIAMTVKETPPDATHWSRSTMDEAVGISPSSVGRIWAEAGLKPHLTKGFKGHCCRTLAVKDSHHESMRLDGWHEQAQARPLP